MGYRKFAILILASFTIASCKKESDSIGYELLPEGDLLEVTYSGSAAIKALSLLDEPATSTSSAGILGTAIDPVFGKSSSSIYMQIYPVDLISDSSFASTFDQATIDSVVLSLAYSSIGGSIYGNSDKYLGAQEVKVYQVQEDMTLATDSSYKSDRSFAYDQTPIGKGWIYPNFLDSVNVGAVNKPAQLRIKLSNSFGHFLRDGASTNGGMKLKDADTFLAFMKGLYVTAENPSQSINTGGFYYLNLSSGYSGLTLYYKTATGTGSVFMKIPDRGSFNHFTHETASLQALSDSSNLNKNTCFVQAMHSMKTRLFFPGILELAKNKKIAIVDAKLVISPQEGTYGTFRRPNKLTALTLDENGTAIATKDAYEISDPASYGAEINADGQYELQITRYLQGLAKISAVDRGLDILRPGGAIYAERLVFNGPNASSNALYIKLKYIEIKN